MPANCVTFNNIKTSDVNLVNSVNVVDTIVDGQQTLLSLNSCYLSTTDEGNRNYPLPTGRDKVLNTTGMINIISPKASTPISWPSPPKTDMLNNSHYLKQLVITNQEILESLLSLHKTILRRLPKSIKNKQLKGKRNQNTRNVSRNFSSLMNEILASAPDNNNNIEQKPINCSKLSLPDCMTISDQNPNDNCDQILPDNCDQSLTGNLMSSSVNNFSEDPKLDHNKLNVLDSLITY